MDRTNTQITVYRPGKLARRPPSELARAGAAIEYLTNEDYVSLLEAASGTTEHRLMIQLLWQTGVRVSEALALIRSDIYPDGINIRHGKGNKQRFVPCQPLLLGDLIRYQETHPDTLRVFLKLAHENSTRYMLRRYADRAGIQKEIHPHLFRHSFAINFLKQTGDPFALQDIGGWSDMETIKIYMRLAKEAPREAIKRMNFPEV
jgi:site-specific recombinase XerD